MKKTLLAVLSFAGSFANAAEFTYSDQGAWTGDCNDGTKTAQSPIDINEATYDAAMPDIHLEYKAEAKVKFYNKKHTVQVGMNDYTMKFQGGNTKYTKGASEYFWPLQVHFHWGVHDGEGSEHYIGGKQYPFEAHIVHVNSEVNVTAGEHLSTVTSAAGGTSPSGLAVIGIMFEVGEANEELEKLANAMDNIKDTVDDEGTTLDSFSLSGLLPKDCTKHFYAYEGGLTTPGCNQAVMWHNCRTPMTISVEQLQKFREATEGDGTTSQAPNYRELQALNGRTIKASTESLVKDLLVAKFQSDYC